MIYQLNCAFVKTNITVCLKVSLLLVYLIGSYSKKFIVLRTGKVFYDCTRRSPKSSIYSLCRDTFMECLNNDCINICCIRVLWVLSFCVMLWYECNDLSNIKHQTFTVNIDTTPILPELVNAHGQLRRVVKSTQRTRVNSRIPRQNPTPSSQLARLIE